MSKADFLGTLEHVVMLALVRLGDDAYGMKVRQEIEARTGRDLSIGAVYATLDRLESKGYVISRTGEPTPERGGRAKRHFRVTVKGVSVLDRTRAALSKMAAGLTPVRSFS